MENYIFIHKDLFNISEKIKRFNKSFKVAYNLRKNRFEIFQKVVIGYQLNSVIPYDKLDMRTIKWLYSSLNANYDMLFREIDEHNKNIEKSKDNENSYVTKNKLKEIYKYSNLSKDFNPNEAFQSSWI